jgi:uncharacterized CHY-type Zn-finger protein
MTSDFGPRPSTSPAICSICQALVQSGEPLRTCDVCRTRFHAECWQHNDGCGTYGCSRAPQPVKMELLAGPESGAWGDTKLCPQCGQTLDSAALKCPHCKAVFDTRAPMTPEEYRRQLERKAAARRDTRLAIVMFVLSTFGILAPLTLPLSVAWIAAHRHHFRRAAGAAELLVCGSAALSLTYAILMVAIFGFGF